MDFEVANITGHYSWDGEWLKILVDCSGPIDQSPLPGNDWIRTNFLFLPLRVGFVRVHAGYYIAALRVRRHLKAEIKKAGRSILWTGHSLGGSVAEVAAFFTRSSAVNLGGAAPWARGCLFVRTFADITWYSHGTDIVPWLPPWYRHGGQHIHIKSTERSPWANHEPAAYLEALED